MRENLFCSHGPFSRIALQWDASAPEGYAHCRRIRHGTFTSFARRNTAPWFGGGNQRNSAGSIIAKEREIRCDEFEARSPSLHKKLCADFLPRPGTPLERDGGLRPRTQTQQSSLLH